jgi:hypothetical protein
MSFEKAVRATPSVSAAYEKGLRALREVDRNRITCRDTRKITGSLNLDAALESTYPNAARWDYAIGLVHEKGRDRICWVEVHPASSKHVREVINKFEWLKDWLQTEALRLRELPREFVWIASGRVYLPPGDMKRNLLAQKGISFRFAGSHLTFAGSHLALNA